MNQLIGLKTQTQQSVEGVECKQIEGVDIFQMESGRQ